MTLHRRMLFGFGVMGALPRWGEGYGLLAGWPSGGGDEFSAGAFSLGSRCRADNYPIAKGVSSTTPSAGCRVPSATALSAAAAS